MLIRAQIALPVLVALALAALPLRAEPGDVESSHDYPGFPRMAGFIITDFDEDNPADFNFPVANPQPMDANHVVKVHVKGHRYVIRYEMSSGQPPMLMQIQQYYEKLAAANGMILEKSGAVGDVSETFRRTKAGRDLWIHLDPSGTVNILTIVESDGMATLPVSAMRPPAAVPSTDTASPASSEASSLAAGAVTGPGAEDPFYIALMSKGRVVLPLAFLPGKPDLDAESQPVINRVVVMLQRHPELALEVVGHTDNSGDAGDNQRLSEQRAGTVRGILIADHVEKGRLVAAGRGGSQPLMDESTATGREKNRRIELVLWSAADDRNDGRFHTPAPGGVNYYPPAKGGL